MQFFRCKHCGNIVMYVENSGVPIVCCGEQMREMPVNVTEAAVEKHIPVIIIQGSTVIVKVGSVAHPMLPEHHISWIFLETKEGIQKKELTEGVPEAIFAISEGDKVVAAYEYCNLHGLWKAEV